MKNFSDMGFEFGDILHVVKGAHAGAVGYFDDEDENDDLIIYDEVPFFDDPIIVTAEDCVKASDDEARRYNETYRNDVAAGDARPRSSRRESGGDK